MEIRNCPVCGKVFVFVARNLCPECIAKEEEEFRKVKDYLYEFPGATMEEISEKTGVSPKKILEFLREGRLLLKKENVNILLRCQMCGSPILTGRICEKCAGEMKRRFGLSKTPLNQGEDMKGRIHLSRYQK
ncbi:TIGR03826 family flagellar region protein [Thermosediminibacter litoriperuensis]|uniref:Flagellar operon protein (TIGR03826 family) n=1 Tax=Thermosediminibacter litoriperuensis TaxID=291989 RepID=A0A5S5ALL6_9FIRM|nr:TIGR03826 family flagellar region protein [Thermosediminibacter litoriperuensis]TYP50911.1 flagellar operon protein (TIGR03826 family) [Thermosediminibacter litoriperuensis]